jgi:hypothetical protein
VLGERPSLSVVNRQLKDARPWLDKLCPCLFLCRRGHEAAPGERAAGRYDPRIPASKTLGSSAPLLAEGREAPSDETVVPCGPFVALHRSQSTPARAGGLFSCRSRSGSPAAMGEFDGSRCGTSKKAAKKKKALLPGWLVAGAE